MNAAGAFRTISPQGAAGDPETLINAFPLPDCCRGNRPLQSLAVELQPPLRRFGIFIQQLKAETPQADLQQVWQRLHTTLGATIEKGVAASQISHKGVFHTTPIPKPHLMLFARSAAIGVVVPLRQEGTEQTVLHMEKRHVLMQGDL